MNISLVVLNYNDYTTVIKFIDNIKKYNLIEKIVIVDNKSTDDSYKTLKILSDEKIEVIQTKENKGYASGNNYGIKYLKEKYNPNYIIVSNPDVYFSEESVKQIIQTLSLNKLYALGTCTMIESQETRNLSAYKIGGYYHHLLSTLPIIGKFYDNKFIKYNKSLFESKYTEVEVIPGSFFIAKTDLFNNIDFFDTDTFLYCEEEILAYKLQDAGYLSVILNNIEYFHDHSISIDKNITSNVKKHAILQQSRRIYLKKYLKVSNIKLKIFDIITFFALKERKVINYIKFMIKEKSLKN